MGVQGVAQGGSPAAVSAAGVGKERGYLVVDRELERAVLDAFSAARDEGSPLVECYKAAVKAWRDRHPDQAPDYAAQRAVSVIIQATMGFQE
jgi:hypothetical protein